MFADDTLIFIKNRHLKYFQRCLKILPYSVASYDTSRMTVLFFALSGIDLLDELESLKEDRPQLIKWIYSLQIVPKNENMKLEQPGGFRGGSVLMATSEQARLNSCLGDLDFGHIAMTYTALASLVILGDDLSGVDRVSINAHIKSLQCEDGSFYSTLGGSDHDMRFVFCAAAICYFLKDFSPINIDAAVNYILTSQSFEGGLGQGPSQEAHGGSTYCGVAALSLMNKLDSISERELTSLTQWLIRKQDGDKGGLKGRPNKPADTCYSFWVGASLKLLDAYEFVNEEELLNFVLTAQDPITGGLSKYEDGTPDGLHTYLGISGLALMNPLRLRKLGLNPVDPSLNISERALNHLKELHKTWPQVINRAVS